MANNERITAIDSEEVHFISYERAETIERRLRVRLGGNAIKASGVREPSIPTRASRSPQSPRNS